MRHPRQVATTSRSALRVPRRVVVPFLLVLAAACAGDKAVPAATSVVVDTTLPAPAESTLVQDAASQSIRRGLALLTATEDSLPTHVGNELRCVSCHLHEGRRAFANPLVGATLRYPRYVARAGRELSIEERINDCFRRSLNGRPIVADGRDMRDIVAYIAWLSSEVQPGHDVWGVGVDSLAPIPPDTIRGKTQFAMYCSRCHGNDGQGGKGTGVLNPGPPLWGHGSFSIGSEMARTRMLASLVHRHMPFDAPGFVAESLAFDVAGFVTSRPRPDFPGKELDWPKGDAPPDSRYKTTGPVKSGAPRP